MFWYLKNCCQAPLLKKKQVCGFYEMSSLSPKIKHFLDPGTLTNSSIEISICRFSIVDLASFTHIHSQSILFQK